MKFSIDEILRITNGKLLNNRNLTGEFLVSTDTRTIQSEHIYLPLKGESFDGHDFINSALDKGVKGYFIDKNHKKSFLEYNQSNFSVLVDDTLEAYLKLANFYRKKINPVVVAITGSSGKTTTKELVYSVLSEKYKVHKSYLNHNNEIGLCQTILSMPEDTDFLIAEMGMRGLGEIELLSKYAEPDIAIITNIGTAHLGRLGSIENIAKAKLEITAYLHKEGAFISFDDKKIKDTLDWKGKSIFYGFESPDFKIVETSDGGSEFLYKNNAYSLNTPGTYNILNALAAIETGKLAGMKPAKINEGLLRYSPIDKRGESFEIGSNIKIINDSYNANPDSVKAAVSSMLESYKNREIVLVLGDMAELGVYEEFYHSQIGRFLSDKQFYSLVTVGEKARLIADLMSKSKVIVKSFTHNEETAKYLIENVNPNSAVLLKASRCMKFEEIAELLKKAGAK